MEGFALMPRLKAKRSEPQQERYEFTEAIALETVRPFFGPEISRGLILPSDHELVQRFPRSFRYLGPYPDGGGVNNGK
jgi:hypothetical protein